MRSGASASITSRRKPRRIAQRAVGIEHALVDGPTHVLQEAGEDPLVDRGDAVFGVEVDLRLVHGVVVALRCGQGELLAVRTEVVPDDGWDLGGGVGGLQGGSELPRGTAQAAGPGRGRGRPSVSAMPTPGRPAPLENRQRSESHFLRLACRVGRRLMGAGSSRTRPMSYEPADDHTGQCRND